MARGQHRAFGRQSARLTQWVGPADQEFITVATTGKTIISSIPFTEPLTVIRTRGAVVVRPNTDTDNTFVGAIGMGIVSADAFAAGVASIPGPYDDGDWGGWFVWRTFAFRQEAVTAASVYVSSQTMEIDSKAMRKVTPNEVLVVVGESQIGAFGIFDGTRHLIKLP